ncbi:MAG TPA: CRISPR-associated endonuclease Cas2 [Thermotogota bacterium]|nr:CRISPR-associated endonuclease Cas2 [Thermotogota bacterium]HRW93813.1 CRISPR-associated endonuclease Cas2 [Thermotogota bacterium]
MFVIMAYDVNEKRVNKVLKTGRKYLTWIQNSLLEGNITEAKFKKLKEELKRITNEEEDSVIWYIFQGAGAVKKETQGVEKGREDLFL